MAKTSSKDRILDSALELFAEKGFDGVGVDLIAENAGFKGPSIYKHFKGKEAILDAIIEKVGAYYAENFGTANNPGQIPPTLEAFSEACFEKIRFTLHDPIIKKTRRIMMMEQYRNPNMAEQATVYSLKNQQNMFSKVFAVLMANGIMKQDDPELLALEFLSPVTLMIQICDRQPEKEEKAMEIVRKHFEHFAKTYGVQKENG